MIIGKLFHKACLPTYNINSYSNFQGSANLVKLCILFGFLLILHCFWYLYITVAVIHERQNLILGIHCHKRFRSDASLAPDLQDCCKVSAPTDYVLQPIESDVLGAEVTLDRK